MPATPYQRLQVVTIPPVRAALERISAVTGDRMGTIIRDYLEAALPGLEAMADALEMVPKNPGEALARMSRTLSDDYAAERIMPSDMAYSAGGSLADKGAVATIALLSIMQIVGFVAMVKALMTVNRYYNNQQAHLGSAAGWLLGGVLCWNFKWFSDVVNNTLGFSIISMFTPFS